MSGPTRFTLYGAVKTTTPVAKNTTEKLTPEDLRIIGEYVSTLQQNANALNRLLRDRDRDGLWRAGKESITAWQNLVARIINYRP